jgi:hypothetical protein
MRSSFVILSALSLVNPSNSCEDSDDVQRKQQEAILAEGTAQTGMPAWLVEIAASYPHLVRDIPLGVPEGTDIRSLGLSFGQALLMKHWQRTNNIGECWTTSPWGNKPGQWTANTRARVADEVQAVKHWRVAREPLGWDQPDVTYFVDPPYQFNYQYGVKGFNWNDLKKGLQQIPKPHQIICCEARCPKTGQVPTWAPFVDFRSTVTSRRKATEHHHSKELVHCRDDC